MKGVHSIYLLIASSLVLFSQCKKQPETALSPTIHLQFDHNYNSALLDVDSMGFTPDTTNYPLTPELQEASGMIPSIVNLNMYWLHEDSGSDAAIYLYHQDGTRKKKYTINQIQATDYEDISLGFGPENQFNYIYLGDIGDNNKYRSHLSIYRFPEPNYMADTSVNKVSHNIEELQLIYPQKNGIVQKENAEAFFIDPISKDLVLFTKSNTLSKVMIASAPLQFGTQQALQHIGNLRFRYQQITAADISSNGQHILVKSYEYIYYWERLIPEPISATLQRAPKRLPYLGEVQGEAICWNIKNSKYVTVSEFGSNITPKFQFYSN